MPTPDFAAFQAEYGARIQAWLEGLLPAADLNPARLHRAMRYAALDGGKRVRPLLVYACGHALGVTPAALDGPAAAIELIHAYSLVHDDLPAMDDDDERRGRPACHRAFDEATAILVGDALQSLAFQHLAEASLPGVTDRARVAMLGVLARAAGSRGMAGGQAMDLAAGDTPDLAELEDLHIHKTGALIRACAQLAALAAPEPVPARAAALDHAVKALGLAFQIRDDVLDAEDGDAGPSYTALLGRSGAQARADELGDTALATLQDFGDEAAPLRALARFILDRHH